MEDLLAWGYIRHRTLDREFGSEHVFQRKPDSVS